MINDFQVCIVGAGLAGLVAAHELQRGGLRVVVLDKARGVGGRLATRRVEDAVFDHGAQFFTTRAPEFVAMVAGWQQAGVAYEWYRGLPSPHKQAGDDAHPRYRGATGMTGVAKHLAQGLDIRLNERATRIEHCDARWEVTSESGAALLADALVLTPPVPQALAITDASQIMLPSAVRASLEAITYEPWLAVLALLEGASRIPPPGALHLEGGPVAWIADNHQKGISPRPGAVTIHAGAEFSRTHWDGDEATVARLLLESVADLLGAPVQSFQLQRWRYSKPATTCPEPCLYVAHPGPLVFAGDAFAGARVEGAALSGLAAARRMFMLRGGPLSHALKQKAQPT